MPTKFEVIKVSVEQGNTCTQNKTETNEFEEKENEKRRKRIGDDLQNKKKKVNTDLRVHVGTRLKGQTTGDKNMTE